MANCCPKIGTEIRTEIKYVEKPVVVPERAGFFDDVILDENLTLEDSTIQLQFLPTAGGKTKVQYKIKRDTVKVMVPVERVVIKEKYLDRKTPRWAWGAVGVALLLTVILILKR